MRPVPRVAIFALALVACAADGASDAGSTSLDAGSEPSDAGGAPVDAGSTPADAGPPPADAGGCADTVCGGDCVDTATDPDHCGDCDASCPEVSDGVRACASGACTPTCDDGFTARAGDCVPAWAPSGSDVDGDGVADVVVGSYGNVSLFLGLADGEPDQDLSPPRSGDPNFGHPIALLGDVDGDGRGDIAVMERGRGNVWVFRGSPGGVDPTFWNHLVGCTESRDTCNGERLSAAGDVDGDGRPDLLVTRTYGFGTGSLYYDTTLHLGTADGIAEAQARTWSRELVLPAGDVDGDGDADLFTRAATVDWIESDGGTYTPHRLALPARFNMRHGIGGADVNGDGYADLVFLSTGAAGPEIVTYLGGPTGPDAASAPIPLEAGLGATFFEWGALGRGDFDGDGYDDVVVGEEAGDPPRVFVFFGGPSGLEGPPSIFDVDGSERNATPVVGIGDADMDGRQDFAIGSRGSGDVRVLYGGPRAGPPRFGVRLDGRGNRTGIDLGRAL